jgi:hypothetical protein
MHRLAHLPAPQADYEFLSFCFNWFNGLRGIDSRAICHARQSLSCSVETDCHLRIPGSWLCLRFAKWWHEHPLKCLGNVCLFRVPVDLSLLHPQDSFPEWPCSSLRMKPPGPDPVLAESATSSACSRHPCCLNPFTRGVEGTPLLSDLKNAFYLAFG